MRRTRILLRHRGEVYCVPQLEDVRGIRIFRAVRYPTEWADAGVLIADVVARDATPFEHDGRWWLAYSGRGRATDGSPRVVGRRPSR